MTVPMWPAEVFDHVERNDIDPEQRELMDCANLEGGG
jgi:hypothetical protein